MQRAGIATSIAMGLATFGAIPSSHAAEKPPSYYPDKIVICDQVLENLGSQVIGHYVEPLSKGCKESNKRLPIVVEHYEIMASATFKHKMENKAEKQKSYRSESEAARTALGILGATFLVCAGVLIAVSIDPNPQNRDRS